MSDENNNGSFPGFGGQDGQTPDATNPPTQNQTPPPPADPNAQSYPSIPDYASAVAQQKNGTGKKIAIFAIPVVGFVLLFAIGAFAFKAFTGDSAGASSPEGVIENTLSSLESQDL